MAYTLSPSNPLVKFAYLFQGRRPPSRSEHIWNAKAHEYHFQYVPTSLCPLFWRCVLNLVACVGAAVAAGVLVFLLGRVLFHLTIRQWWIILASIGSAGALAGSIFGLVHVLSREGMGYGPKVIDALDKAGDTLGNGITRFGDWMCMPLIWDMIKAVKSKMCPIVEFKE